MKKTVKDRIVLLALFVVLIYDIKQVATTLYNLIERIQIKINSTTRLD